MNILFTAFKGSNNPSFQLVGQIATNYVLLTNSFQGLEKDISLIRDGHNRVYMFGVDKNLTGSIRIETCATMHNEMVHTALDISALEGLLKSAEIPYFTSDTPTHYLCNAAYYHMLKKNPNAVFIHIPSFRGLGDEMMEKLICTFKVLENQ